LNQLTHNMTRDCSLNPPKNTSSEHVVYKNCVFVLTFKTIFVHNLLPYCGLTDARMRASEKDLHVLAGEKNM